MFNKPIDLAKIESIGGSKGFKVEEKSQPKPRSANFFANPELVSKFDFTGNGESTANLFTQRVDIQSQLQKIEAQTEMYKEALAEPYGNVLDLKC